jgi:hypothetical protein
MDPGSSRMRRVSLAVSSRKDNMLNRMFVILVILVASNPLLAGESYYNEPQVYQSRPRVDKEMALDCIGATGIKARFYPGVVLRVESIYPDSPAEGKLKPGQIISGVNGTLFKGSNPIVILGKAITAAEGSDGVLAFMVKDDEDGDVSTVAIQIPVLGSYSDTWPLKCEKSDRIIKQAADYYAKDPTFRQKYFGDKSENGGIPSALACLFLLSTGDDEYIPVVKQYFEGFPQPLSKIGDHTWNNGYNGIAVAEYYLRTGDKRVLPILQYYCDNAKERQCFGCGWQHWGRSINPRYVAGGLMNPAGCQVLTTLLLGKACGVNVDDETLMGALRFWYRFVGHGTVPYGDHRSEGGLGSNGKDGMAAAAMRIAMRASKGGQHYEQAMKHLSMATLTSYPSLIRGHADEGRGDGIWRGVASAYMRDYEPDAYHTAMQNLAWWYDLSRRPSGAFGMATNQRFDDEGSGAGVALAYTAPLKTLQITGAPRSKYAVDFALPERLWGNEADLVFLSIENVEGFDQYGEEEPIHIPFYRYGSAYSRASDLASIPRADILKNVHHKRYMIRAQAAKALRITDALDSLEELLADKDPRVRRAALDGLMDYRYWFHIGKNPLAEDKFTSGLKEGVFNILMNPDESLYVIDGALSVMSLMPSKDIGNHLDLVLPWTKHEEWWLRQSAFSALIKAARDESLTARVLPTMLDMLLAEDHTMPRDGMVNGLNQLIKQFKPASKIGQQILAAHVKAVESRNIIPGQRAGEGEWDIKKSTEVVLKQNPDQAIQIAQIAAKRLDDFSTGWLVSLTAQLADTLEIEQKTPQHEALQQRLVTDFRQCLIERMREGNETLAVLDAIANLTSLNGESVGWQPLGAPHTNRVWRYRAIEPEGNDRLHHREKKRFRNLHVPDELSDWMAPDFDDSKWSEGRAPIGVGVFKKRDLVWANASEWGDEEFLLARTTFDVDALDYDYYRLSILANQGFDVFLNGKKIQTYVWWRDDPHYRKIMLGSGAVKHLKVGVNHLAVRAGSDYVKGKHVGQIDCYIEGLRKHDLLGD